MKGFKAPKPTLSPHRCFISRGGQPKTSRHTVLEESAGGSKCRQTVISRGLLDSYRQEKGLASGVTTETKPKFTRHPRKVVDGACGEDDDSLCTPECVREIFTAAEFDEVLEQTNPNTLVVVDFYKKACGSCRYIQPGFVKLCRSSEEEHAPVTFLKHNVIDAADQETDLGERLNIRNVPLFQFYKGGQLLEQFATREKRRIGTAINTHVGWEVCHF